MSLQLSSQLESEINTVSELERITITTNEQNTNASVVIKRLRGLKKVVEENFNPHIQTANKAWKDLIASKNKYLEPIERCEEIIEGKMKQYLITEKQRQIEAQRKADELAEKEAQKERDRLAKQAEKLQAKGKSEEAEAKLQEILTVTAMATIVQSRAEKQEGISGVERYTFKVINEQLIPREFLQPDMVKIRKYVNAMKKDARIPGVKIEEDISIRVKV